MNLIDLGVIEKQISQASKSSIKKLNSTAKKSAVMCLFFQKNKKTFILLTKIVPDLSVLIFLVSVTVKSAILTSIIKLYDK